MSRIQKLRNRTHYIASSLRYRPISQSRWFKPGAMLISSEQENQSKMFGLLRVMLNETTGFRSLAYTPHLIKTDAHRYSMDVCVISLLHNNDYGYLRGMR